MLLAPSYSTPIASVTTLDKLSLKRALGQRQFHVIRSYLRFPLTQNGNELTGGAAFVDGCHAGQSGTIIGSVRDIRFSFDLTLEDETVMNFEGAIAHDFCALGGSYSSVNVAIAEDGFGHWALSCQK